MSSARRVRRASLSDRLKAYLNPWDLLLWLSEEVDGDEWQDACMQWATPAGVVVNLVFMLARANVGRAGSKRGDDVFGDARERSGSGWLSWTASLVVYLLGVCSIVNAIYTFSRKRHYRLFEATVEVVPSTPSARRVRVESSPSASSPMRYLNRLIDMTKAESRAYPDSVRDVWEVTIWDPKPLCLALFCLFSPGHVLVYCLFLPSRPLDPRPSVTVLTTMSLAALFSALLVLMKNFFTQQAKDAALINKEVAREYDTKFVHPSLNKPVRDVGTQMIPAKYTHHIPEVETYTPTTYVNRGFYVSPNPNYAPHFNPDGLPQDSPRAQRSVVGTPLRHAPSMAGANDLSASYRATPTPAMRLQASGNALRECGLAKRQSSPLKHSSAPADGSEAARGNGIAPLRRATEGFHVRRH